MTSVRRVAFLIGMMIAIDGGSCKLHAAPLPKEATAGQCQDGQMPDHRRRPVALRRQGGSAAIITGCDARMTIHQRRLPSRCASTKASRIACAKNDRAFSIRTPGCGCNAGPFMPRECDRSSLLFDT
jgi:hypothetical protein